MTDFCIRRRWAFSAAGFTLASCVFFVGLILVLPFRSESWTMGLVLLALSIWIAALSIGLPLVGSCIKHRRKERILDLDAMKLATAATMVLPKEEATEENVRVFEGAENEVEL